MDNNTKIIITLVSVGALLILILVPLTFSYVEYYEYGLDQRKTTSAVDITKVYSKGRYALGPDHQFIKYQADAHVETLRGFSVFSSGDTNSSIGLDFLIDIDYTYLLQEDQIGVLHQELAKSYKAVIASRANDAIKNEAAKVTFTDYFQNRRTVEERFQKAVQDRWKAPPALQCTLDQFHLGRIQIPASVAEKQLESKIQNERNDQESYSQQAQLEREQTDVQVNAILLEQEKVLRTAEAEASLIRSRATSTASQLIANAQTKGTLELTRAASIQNQEHLTAFTYIRTLQNRNDMTLNVNYLTPENIVKTRNV